MKSEILVTNYETGWEKKYDPPLEIKLLLQKNTAFRQLAETIGTNPALQKLWGNIFGSEHFAENRPRQHHADGTTVPVLPSDGYLTRSVISNDAKSEVLGHVQIDIKKMLGLRPSSYNLSHKKEDVFDKNFQENVRTEMDQKLPNFENGFHDLAILKPRHKHVCTVPFKSTLKQMYRVGNNDFIFPADIPHHRLPHEKVYSVDPIVALENAERLKIFDGNQRMIFLLETIIDDEPLEYVMVAHAAAFVAGIEALVSVGETISPKTPLFKFHQGSALTTLWPQKFCEKFQTLPDIERLTTKNRVIEVLEGQVIYSPKFC